MAEKEGESFQLNILVGKFAPTILHLRRGLLCFVAFWMAHSRSVKLYDLPGLIELLENRS
ncbi:unnamed protein product [Prunus armeniaca]